MATPAAAATDQAESRAILVSALSFFNVQGLKFGDIIPSTTAGVVRILPDGTRTTTGGVTGIGAHHQEARFAGMGVYNQIVRIRLNANTIQLTRVGGGGTPMTVSQFEIGSSPTTVILSTSWQNFRLGSATGQFNFGIGARLGVNANQMPGVYAGTFAVQLEYM